MVKTEQQSYVSSHIIRRREKMSIQPFLHPMINYVIKMQAIPLTKTLQAGFFSHSAHNIHTPASRSNLHLRVTSGVSSQDQGCGCIRRSGHSLATSNKSLLSLLCLGQISHLQLASNFRLDGLQQKNNTQCRSMHTYSTSNGTFYSILISHSGKYYITFYKRCHS